MNDKKTQLYITIGLVAIIVILGVVLVVINRKPATTTESSAPSMSIVYSDGTSAVVAVSNETAADGQNPAPVTNSTAATASTEPASTGDVVVDPATGDVQGPEIVIYDSTTTSATDAQGQPVTPTTTTAANPTSATNATSATNPTSAQNTDDGVIELPFAPT